MLKGENNVGGRGAISTSGRIAKAAATTAVGGVMSANRLIENANKQAGIAKRTTRNAASRNRRTSSGVNSARTASNLVGSANVQRNLTQNARNRLDF